MPHVNMKPLVFRCLQGVYKETIVIKWVNKLYQSLFHRVFSSNKHSEALPQICQEFETLKIPSFTEPIFNEVTSAGGGTHRFLRLSHRSEMLHNSQRKHLWQIHFLVKLQFSSQQQSESRTFSWMFSKEFLWNFFIITIFQNTFERLRLYVKACNFG